MTNKEAIKFGNMWLEINEDCKDSSTYTFFQMAIKVLEQQPKTAHWIEKEDCNLDIYYDCSECGESFCLIDGTPTDYLYNYCPNCGARMAESEGK